VKKEIRGIRVFKSPCADGFCEGEGDLGGENQATALLPANQFAEKGFPKGESAKGHEAIPIA